MSTKLTAMTESDLMRSIPSCCQILKRNVPKTKQNMRYLLHALITRVVISIPQSESHKPEGNREARVGEEDTGSHTGFGGHKT